MVNFFARDQTFVAVFPKKEPVDLEFQFTNENYFKVTVFLKLSDVSNYYEYNLQISHKQIPKTNI